MFLMCGLAVADVADLAATPAAAAAAALEASTAPASPVGMRQCALRNASMLQPTASDGLQTLARCVCVYVCVCVLYPYIHAPSLYCWSFPCLAYTTRRHTPTHMRARSCPGAAPCPRHYMWRYSAFSPCSRSCGGGVMTRVERCVRADGALRR